MLLMVEEVVIGGFVVLMLMIKVFQEKYDVFVIYVWGMIEFFLMGIMNSMNLYMVGLFQEECY